MGKKIYGAVFSLILLGLAFPSLGMALDYPTKTIQLVVGMSAGGPADLKYAHHRRGDFQGARSPRGGRK